MEKLIKNKKEVRTALALGGLLHDIGKVTLRTLSEEERKNLHQQIGKEIRYRDIFGYAHAYHTYLFLKEEKIMHPIVKASAYHHNPEKAEDGQQIYAKIYQLADQFSSVERSKKEKEMELEYLRPIFQMVYLFDTSNNKREQKKDFYIYKLKPLAIDEKIIFPEKIEGEKEKDLKLEVNLEYKNLWNVFKKEFEICKKFFENDLEKALYLFYHLCYKYFWCIPSSTYDPERKERHYPDISLFDHLRVTSAFATSLFTEYNLSFIKNSSKNLEKDLKFVFIKGDISGIQNFLYGITNIKGVAKRLRGRSCFLALLSELIAKALLRRLEYPFTNILFAGGGHFELVVGYEEDLKEFLEKFNEEIEEIFLREFKGKLGLILGDYEISLYELKENGYIKINKGFYSKIDEKKKRKFLNIFKNNSYEKILKLINSDYEYLKNKNFIICSSCHNSIIEEKEGISEEEQICDWCKTFEQIGKNIPKAKYLLLTENQILTENQKPLEGFYLENIGGVYFIENLKEIPKDSKNEIYLLNNCDFMKDDTGLVKGFKFIAKSVPFDKDEVIPFENLVEEAEGEKKLAFARADVDNLGLIFMKGLEEDYSISRIATLSRSLDLFFSGYLNKLFEKKDYDNKIYTLYAGGDDLFVIGPWNIVFKAVKDIRDKFKQYTCNNSDLNLSCGIFVARHSYPVRFAGDNAGRFEDKAKEDKPAICALDEVLKWEDFIKALEEGDQMVKFMEEKNIGRTLIYKFYQLLQEYVKNNEKKDSLRYRFYPLFYYYLYRNIKKEEDRRKMEEFILDVKNDYQIKENIMFKIKYVLMKTRKT